MTAEHTETAILCADGKTVHPSHIDLSTLPQVLHKSILAGIERATRWNTQNQPCAGSPHTIRRRSVGEWLPIDEEQQ